MKNKEIKEIINMLDENQAKMIKEDKKQKRKQKISDMIWILACLSVVIVLISIVGIQTKKDIKKCLKNGYSENYCLRSSY